MANIDSMIADARNTWNSIFAQGQAATDAFDNSIFKFIISDASASEVLQQQVNYLENFWNKLGEQIAPGLGT